MDEMRCRCGLEWQHNESCAIPEAPYYVVSTDRFMGGWGMAKGQRNKCVVPCEDMDEVERVMRYVESRDEQSHVHFLAERPRDPDNVRLSIVHGWRRLALEMEAEA